MKSAVGTCICVAFALSCAPASDGPAPVGTDPTPPSSTAPPTSTGSPPSEPTSPPGTFDAAFLWAPLSFEGAVDLGHAPGDVASPVEAGPLVFSEVAGDAGLASSAIGGNQHGVGLAFVDVDADGWDDLVAIAGVGFSGAWDSQLWRNQGDGTFVDATASSGLGAVLAGVDGLSVAAGDLDADGDVDLYVGAHPTDRLLLNGGDGTFTDGTAAAGAGGPPSAAGSSNAKLVGVGDYDGDGLLDVVSASDTFVDPGPNGYVLRNLGGTFRDVTAETGFFAPVEGTPCALMWTDHDADGYGDLAIWSDLGDPVGNRVLLGSDGLAFQDLAAEAGWTAAVGNPMGIDAADLDRDGGLDYFVGDEGTGLLLLSMPGGTWIDGTAAADAVTRNTWGLGFEDLDADGWWDLFAAGSGVDPHRVLRHLGTVPPTFAGEDLFHGSVGFGNVAAAFADYDHDGDVDAATAGTDGGAIDLFRNDTARGTHRWLEVRVDAAPGDGAAGAVTARVVASVGGEVLWRDVTGGASRGSQSALSARFGLGQRTGAEWVGVLWPDGRQVVALGVPGDAVLVFDGEGATLR